MMNNFHSSGMKQKIDQLMDTLWAGGVNNPMDSIGQISYLISLKILSERDELMKGLDSNYTPIFSGEWESYTRSHLQLLKQMGGLPLVYANPRY